MTIRRKLALLSGAVVTAFLVIFVVMVRLILLDSFLGVERRQVEKDVARVRNDLQGELHRLSAVAGDWSGWNEAWAFVEGRSPDFVKENMGDSSLATLRVNFMLYADARGRVVYSKLIDLEKGVMVDKPTGFDRQVTLDGALTHHADEKSSYSGILRVSGIPALVASRPVLNNQFTGPVHGALVVGRFLDEREIAEVAERTQLAVALLPVDDPSIRDISASQMQQPALDGHASIRPINDRIVAGYALLRGIDDKPLKILRIEEPRDTFLQGINTTVTSILAFIVLGAVMLAFIQLLLGRYVIMPLRRIDAFVGRTSAAGTFNKRLPVRGEDELALLSGMVNSLLDTVEKTNEELQAATQEAVVANRTKSEFLANMSHELRTPLNHIIGFTELVAEGNVGPLEPTQKEYLGDVLASSRHLLSLINDILDLSKVEAGRLELEPARVILEPLLSNSLRMVTEKAAKHGIQLSLETAGAPDVMIADERKLKQIIFNLLSNAVKFTPDGGSVSLKVSPKPPGMVEFVVADTGIGISAEEISRLFTPYARGNAAKDRYEGTGLGLALSRRLVHLHGGEIWAESAGPGKGSAFHVVLPVGQP